MTTLNKYQIIQRNILFPKKEYFSGTGNAMNVFFLVIYLLLAWIITSLVLTFYSSLLEKFIGPLSYGREFIVCGGQMIFQLLFMSLTGRRKAEVFIYLGNMMTISLGGAVLLLPVLVIGKMFSGFAPVFFLPYFLFVAGLMLLEHLRRMKITGLPKWLSATWVLYRVLVLIVILGLEEWKAGRLGGAINPSTLPTNLIICLFKCF